jgi:SRSO17 transposase
VAVSLSVSTRSSSLPVAWRLYLPEVWTSDAGRREATGVPREIEFQTKPEIALRQIQDAVKAGIPTGVVLADAAYGNDTKFRTGITKLQLLYVAGIQSSTTVWKPGGESLPKPQNGKGRPPQLLLQPDDAGQQVSVKDLAFALPASAWKKIEWREGSRHKLQSRFAAVRVRPAHGDREHAEEWLLIEWPKQEPEPAKYWFSTLPATTPLEQLVLMAKHRWIIERDYQELKQELGLGHYEGRGWRGFHHHASLCIAAYGFLVAERNRFSPSTRAGYVGLSAARPPASYQPRGAPRSSRAS